VHTTSLADGFDSFITVGAGFHYGDLIKRWERDAPAPHEKRIGI
jgi:hypothetical protein